MAEATSAVVAFVEMDIVESSSSSAKASGPTPDCSGACGPSGGAAAAAMFDLDGLPIRDPSEKLDVRYLLNHAPNVDEEEEDCGETASGGHCSAGSGGCGETATMMIESQFQPYDDDDPEYGESSDDEGTARQEAEWNAGAQGRQRRSSLKNAVRSPSSDHGSTERSQPANMDAVSTGSGDDHSGSGCPSPGPYGQERKAVRFADVEGQGQLAEVHDLVNPEEPPTVPASALKDLHVRRRKRSRSGMTWTLDFEQPGSDPGFITRVLNEKVALENCVALAEERNPLTISGVVRVANVAYDKRVLVRWTADGWTSSSKAGGREGSRSTQEVSASYLPGSSDGCTDRFAFVIHPSPEAIEAVHHHAEEPSTISPKFEFVVSYEAGGMTYWDNNAGRNYGVVLSSICATPSTPGTQQVHFGYASDKDAGPPSSH